MAYQPSDLEFRYEYRYQDDVYENEKDNACGSEKNSKKGVPHTWGTSISFGFRRRNGSGIPVPVSPHQNETSQHHQRSKSAGPEHTRRRDDETRLQNASSGRSTPRLAPPKKEVTGLTIRTNRFGFRHPQPKYTDKVSDVCSHPSHVKQDHPQFRQDHPQLRQNHPQFRQDHSQLRQDSPQETDYPGRQGRLVSPYGNHGTPRSRSSPSNHPSLNNNNVPDNNRKIINIPEPISKYTLQTSHLPQPQFAVRVNDNSKVAKTVANQNRKVAAPCRGGVSSKEGSGTEDSGIGSQHGYADEFDYGYPDGRRRAGYGRPRNLKMVVNGKSFDVRDVDDDNTVTEISVIPLPKNFVSPNLNTGLVRERTNQYQRNLNKDNRYNDSTTSMSTTSSEGYDEGLDEEKVYKDRSEKIPSIKSDFSPISSDDPEYGHGEAMADEYSFSSSEEGRQSSSMQYLKKITKNCSTMQGKTGAMPKCNLRSVLLTIEDPAFAAVAAKSTTLIDDETSPVDSLFDSPTASITQNDGQTAKKECAVEKLANGEDGSPGTPTNASNSLSLSEGREYFDDEIADQPGLVFDDTLRSNIDTSGISQSHTENTLVGCKPLPNQLQRKSTENSLMHGQKLPRTRSIDTLSSCESIASDDLMMDYERSDASSCGDMTHRLNSTSNFEVQEEVMREWISIMGVNEIDLNTNNNVISPRINNNNNTQTAESGISSSRTSRLLKSRSGTDSPRSLDSVRSGSKQVFSPLRTPRNVQSPSIDSGDEGSLRMDRGTYQYMSQDIVCIKTMLLKLKRILQESGENGLTRAEPLNPFDNSVKNGLFYNLNEGESIDASTTPGNGSVADELADLRRQVVFLQGQLEDKDRTIQSLQSQLTKYQGQNNSDSQSVSSVRRNVETCNNATQTEKMRPVSTGPSILQQMPQDGNMGPLISWNNSWDHPKSSLTETQPKPVHKYRIPNGKESPLKSASPKIEPSPVKSAIPTPRRLATPTLIPRAARAISATGRSHNT